MADLPGLTPAENAPLTAPDPSFVDPQTVEFAPPAQTVPMGEMFQALKDRTPVATTPVPPARVGARQVQQQLEQEPQVGIDQISPFTPDRMERVRQAYPGIDPKLHDFLGSKDEIELAQKLTGANDPVRLGTAAAVFGIHKDRSGDYGAVKMDAAKMETAVSSGLVDGELKQIWHELKSSPETLDQEKADKLSMAMTQLGDITDTVTGPDLKHPSGKITKIEFDRVGAAVHVEYPVGEPSKELAESLTTPAPMKIQPVSAGGKGLTVVTSGDGSLQVVARITPETAHVARHLFPALQGDHGAAHWIPSAPARVDDMDSKRFDMQVRHRDAPAEVWPEAFLRTAGGHPAVKPGNQIVFSFDDLHGLPIKKLRQMGEVLDLGGVKVEEWQEDADEPDPELRGARGGRRARKVAVLVAPDAARDMASMANEIEFRGGSDIAIYSHAPSVKGFVPAREHVYSDGAVTYAVRSKDPELRSSNGSTVWLRPDVKLPDLSPESDTERPLAVQATAPNRAVLNNSVAVNFPGADVKRGPNLRSFTVGGKRPIAYGVMGGELYAIMDKAQHDEQAPMFDGVVRFGKESGRPAVIVPEGDLAPAAKALAVIARAGVNTSGALVRRQSDGAELTAP